MLALKNEQQVITKRNESPPNINEAADLEELGVQELP